MLLFLPYTASENKQFRRDLLDRLNGELAKPEQEVNHQNPAAKHWHDMYRAKCKDFHDAQASLGAEIVALEEEIAELKEDQVEPDFKLSDAGADTNISRGLEPKGSGMVTLNQVGMRVDLKDTPPRKPWLSLSDDEQYQIVTQCGAMSADWQDFVVAIEAKLKELNT
jgi:hypothetical protein